MRRSNSKRNVALMLVLSLLFAMLPTSVMADQSAQLLSSETSQTAQVDEVIVENTLLQEDSLQSESDTGNQAEASKEATITQTFRGPISLMVNVGDVFEVAPYKYKVLSENTVALGDGNGSAFVGGANFPTGTVTLPTSVEYNGVTYKVTEISDSAFRTLETNVTTLKIPGTITKIGFGSFRETKGIKNFVLEHGVTYLDQAAFREADAKSITVPATVNYYGNRALDAPVNNAGDEIAIFEGGLPASTEIYARRAPFFSVRFLNESGSVVESHNIAPGGAVPDPYPAVPPKSGYTAVWSPQDGFDLSEAVNHGFTISPVYTEMDSMTVFDDGVLRYTIDSDTTVMLGDGSNLGALVVTDGSVKYGTLRIPETVTYEDKTYTVTSVADNAFRGFPQDLASGAKFVVRFNWARNIVAVGDSAFRDMYNFEMYNVLSEVKSIGDSAFRDTPFAAALSIGINTQLEAMKALGELAGLDSKERSDELVAYYQDIISYIEKRVSQIPENERLRVYHANSGPLSTDGALSIGSDWIARCGGINVSSDKQNVAGQRSYETSVEQVYLWDPDVIICNEGLTAEAFRYAASWRGLRAVKEKKSIQHTYWRNTLGPAWIGRDFSRNALVCINFLP